jgi:hypothetical protein
LKPNTAHANIHYRLGDMLDDNGLTQLVNTPTRGNNTLDLVLNKQPTRFPKITTIPGVSDHDIVYFEIDSAPIRNKQRPRMTPLYNRARWDTMRADISQTEMKVTEMSKRDAGVEEQDLERSVNNDIPQKKANVKENIPWITPGIKKLIIKRGRLFKRMKKSADASHKDKFMEIRGLIQKELCRAYWAYIEDIVTQNEEDNQYSGMKRLWTYIKHKRTDNSSISPLRSNGVLHNTPVRKSYHPQQTIPVGLLESQ